MSLPPTESLYIGLMSGTSLDGVDGVVFDAQSLAVLAHAHRPFPVALRAELLALNESGPDELHRAAQAAQGVARLCAQVTAELRQAHPEITAVCAHGQTVRHCPAQGYTLQLINGALLAELTGVDVICDLRSRDVAAGGQGAPLVPAFHRAVFGRDGQDVAILNLGGIANLSLLHADGRTAGFDTGPANCLMDAWIEKHQGLAFDRDGGWAAQGEVMPRLLATLLAESYFHQPPPRSTGRDLFSLAWLEARLPEAAKPVDVQATLLKLTAVSVAEALKSAMPRTQQLIACGGGARNGQLMRRLQDLLPDVAVTSSTKLGLPVDQVEAAAFAWLGYCFKTKRPGNLPAVTGALGPRLLGALYPA